MSNAPKNPKSKILAESLSSLIAESFGEPSQQDWYHEVCTKHDWHTVYRAYREVMEIPVSHIRKSRRALFVYLIRKYESKK